MMQNSLVNKIIIGVSFLGLVTVIIYLLPMYNDSFNYQYEEGKPWIYNTLVAQEDFAINKTSAQIEEERRKILRSYTPYYNCSPLDSVNDLCVMEASEKEELRNKGIMKVAVVTNKKVNIYPLDSIFIPKTAYMRAGREVPVNLVFDSVTSNRILDNYLSKINPTQGLVQKGEKIIDRGDIVSAEDVRILNTIKEHSDQRTISYAEKLYSQIANGILVSIFLGLFLVYILVFQPTFLQDIGTVLFFFIISGIVICSVLLIIRYSTWDVYFFPVLLVLLMARVFYDAQSAIFLQIITILVLSLAVPHPLEYLVIQIIVSMVALFTLRTMMARSQLARTTVVSFIAYCVIYLAFHVARSGDWNQLNGMHFVAFAGCSLALLGSYGLIFVVEKIFGLTSSITLIELSNINSELMLKFAEQCPGSFQHSLQVSTLATEAAKKIGANTLLVRTGALYHDIGKLAHPNNFTENQSNSRNPLLELRPIEAAKAVIAHVEDGVKIAKKNRIPDSVINFIITHHGNSLVKFFYTKYKETFPNDIIDEALFRYNGPKPFDKETAIVMMADGVEARSRSLKVYSKETISEMVEAMVNDQLTDQQFSNTPLSFRDMTTVKEVFKEKLEAIYHHRIAYPTLPK